MALLASVSLADLLKLRKLKGAAKEKAAYAQLRSQVFVRNYERDLRMREFKATVADEATQLSGAPDVRRSMANTKEFFERQYGHAGSKSATVR